ncbi:DUF7716 domain-containing protein [Pleionea litopenaei]|uniref:DUF7716 domain-containing protein n=1 Tax=Pleionea litopenaei TaxID=3070815 RepID=A0AA51RVF4_9GAMM|nr:hypothetical protein [Pleionea sp. HL-JVS1]WMS88383.1 hypothetical protein Q9312_05575 [Pleionea sp. HL-JVS1]
MKGDLKEVFEKVDAFAWDRILLVADGVMRLDSRVALIEDDGVSETFDDLKYFLTIQYIQSIKTNLCEQISNPNPDQMLEALRYYQLNDAFIKIQG